MGWPLVKLHPYNLSACFFFSGKATLFAFDDATEFAVFGLGTLGYLVGAPLMPTDFLAFDDDYVFETAVDKATAAILCAFAFSQL